MYKELKKIEKIDFNYIGSSRLPVFGFEFKRFSKRNIKSVFDYVIDKYGYVDVGVEYLVDYEGRKKWEHGDDFIVYDFGNKVYSKDIINMKTYTGVSLNSKYVKKGFFYENISLDLPIYLTNNQNSYIHLLYDKLSLLDILEICIDTMNYDSGIDLFFVFIKDDFIIYPHTDRGFNFIDISGENGNISKDILNYVDSNFDVKIGGNDLFVDYCKEYSIKHN